MEPDRASSADSYDDQVTDWSGFVAVPGDDRPPAAAQRCNGWDRLPDSFLRDDTRTRLDRAKKTTSVVRLLDKVKSLAMLPPGAPGTGLDAQAIGYREAAAACLALAEQCEREVNR